MLLENIINKIQQDLNDGLKFDDITSEDSSAILEVIHLLDQGKLRVSEKMDTKEERSLWKTNEWVKQAILFYFRLQKMRVIDFKELSFYDKIPVKNWSGKENVRVVPPAVARYGSFINAGVVLMPSYTNIGAYIDTGTMIDTWATVGSCAQIGKNVHLSGGVGIGGVLEPIQAQPVIIEDNAFIGSRCIIVEGALIEEGAVLGAGVTITSSTKIIDVTTSSPIEYKGIVPKNSVVIPGSLNKKFPAGDYGVPCALIIGKRKPSTDLKTSLNETLREFQISV
ncbi:MAG: 2,3,4,5-tetrahydropyridine-2,6-dicarboxylate N-succinyltransferase [Bdellovibrionaceae bacterium]|nr:2,3,4,5-tetrahydropyridine-2,6-dicarboxylate N-succinyltransferase [Pseudobdellovibrionaceae bacterium]